MFDLALHGDAYVGELVPTWVYIKDGVIARVSREPVGQATASIELDRSQFLIPAATDLHVHLRDWSQASKETVETGTASALAGGVTTVAEMPNTVPKLDSAELVEERIELLRERSLTDFAVHASPPREAEEFRRIKGAGAFAVKLYPPDLEGFRGVLRNSQRAGLKVAVHAEDESSLAGGDASGAELVAVRKILGEVGPHSDVRFAHLSTPAAARTLVGARASHRGLTIEVSPHHLFMDSATAAKRIGKASKVNPRLTPAASAKAMRRLLGEGKFDFYATDHAPHTAEDKLRGAPGFPGLELALPLFLTRTDNLELLCRMFCEAPAAYLGIKKGKISPGYTADLVVMGSRSWRVNPDHFVSKARVTPFAGEEMRYSVEKVLLRGGIVFPGGRFVRHSSQLVP